MNYLPLTDDNLATLTKLYVEYYNTHDDCCWTFDKAYRKLHQMMTIEDSLCLVQCNDQETITGLSLGYFKEYDDITSFILEEITVFAPWQGKGYGTLFFQEIENRIRAHGALHMDLLSVNDDMHMHFYGKLGMYAASNLKVMGKHYETH